MGTAVFQPPFDMPTAEGNSIKFLAYAYLVIRGDETSDNFVSRVQDNLQITDRRAGLVSQRAGLVSFGPWYLSDEKYQGCKNPKKSVQSTGHSQNQRGQVTQVLRKPC